MIAQLVYLLCGLTSVACAVLLLRGYRANRVRLLLWSGLCFALLAASNIVLFIDLVLTPPTLDLSILRTAIAAAGHLVLLVGLISKSKPS